MKRIIVFGAGALGSNLLANLCADLRDKEDLEFIAIDFDKIEDRNILPATQFFNKDQIGMSKVEALRVNIFRLSGVKVTAIDKRVDREFLKHEMKPEKETLMIDCFDNTESRALLKEFYTGVKPYEKEWSLLHIGFSPTFTAEITWDESYEVPNDVKGFDICEMIGARGFVQLISSLGSHVVSKFITHGLKLGYLVNDFIVKRLN